ncbi:YppF family protein [Bacillus sp. FJAT-27251]|uniref:YppF family protein n=1 Tax=Bacillus sp. FJAT-27251 TaxID=1684142 RepID=UPI0006A7977D|nr:YppF family protein [Bacillus sp. FJAT-27251]
MNVHELTLKFIQVRNHTPEHANELLDFAKKAYVHNEISFSEYRLLVRELELRGAANTPENAHQNS